MRPRLLVRIFAASTCALAGVAIGLVGVAGNYQPAFDPDRCAIHSTDPGPEGVTVQTVASNEFGRVWTKDYYGKRDHAHYTRFYACWNRHGKHVFLGSAREASYEGDEAHRGSFIFASAQGLGDGAVAFSKITCPDATNRASCGSKLRVVRLDREGGEARPPISRRHAVIEPPLVSERGEIYYGLERPTVESACGNGCEIHRIDRHGRDRLLDSGADLRLDSMTVAPNYDFFWRDGTGPHVHRGY